MKKIFALSTLATMLFASCSNFEDSITALTPNNSILQAGFADDTRTYVENNTYLRWHEDDRLTAFYGNTLNRQYKFNGKTGDNSGTFSLVPSGELGTGNAFDHIYALYPYSETATITDDGVISLTLPATQSYAENSFGRGANTMIAVTENIEDTFLSFKNACGYLKLKLYAPEGAILKSIEVKGNNNEKIAGTATATIAFGEAPVVTMADDATTSITLDCGEGVTLGTTAETATEFWVVVPETTFTQGITITATDNLGGVFTKSTDKEVNIERNTIQPMAALAADVFEGSIPNNEIRYTSTDGAVVTPYNTNVFGANILSNTYENGKGIIKFDGDVTKVGYYAFYECNKLTSINIPNSITSIGERAFCNCDALTSINIPNSVTSIGVCAFNHCDALIGIDLSNISSIGAGAFTSCVSLTSITLSNKIRTIKGFSYCKALTTISIPEGVIAIEAGAFAESGLTNISIPHTVISIGKEAFYNCKSLNSVVIPLGSITTIEAYTFYGCSSMRNVVIEDGVTTINAYAFNNCKSVETVDLPCTIQTIDHDSFYGCSNLKSIYCRATKNPKIQYLTNSINTNPTFPNNSKLKIYVPREAYDSYTSSRGYSLGLDSDNWYGWKSNIEPYDFE